MTVAASFSSLSIHSAPSKVARRTFTDLDERVVQAEPGLLIVRAPSNVRRALVTHLSRRLRANGLSVTDVAARPGSPVFREAATVLGRPSLPSDALLFAEALATAANERRAAILAPSPREGSWDHVVAGELARASRALVILLASTSEALPSFASDANVFELTGELSGSDRLRWLAAVAEEAQRDVPSHDLRALEAWWAKPRGTGPDATTSLHGLGESARALLTLLALAGRSVPERAAAASGSDALDSLLAMGIAQRSGAFISLSPSCDVRTVDARAKDGELIEAARVLTESAGTEPDAWSFARAAELYVRAGEFERADTCITTALRRSRDLDASTEIANRWHDVVAPIAGESGLMLRVRAAERALASGEASDGQRWCEGAAAIAPEDPTVMLLRGRALMLLGDLVAARASLLRAGARAEGRETHARVAAELAELDYLNDDHEAATDHAKRAIELAETVATRFAGRSTLGKLLLATGQWAEADAHFADDALTLSAAGETAAELRARLNRSIAVMSKGLLDEARAMLEDVLRDGIRAGEERACVFALSNLGVVAHRQHEYGKALSYWDRAIKYPAALSGRMPTALTIANLAELRLRLGLVDHAEHAVMFGRRLFVGSAPATRSAHFKLVSAQIALVRRNSDLARREIDGAIADAQASRNREYLDATLNVAARIALEDGDLERTARLLDQAEAAAANSRAQTETAILRAYYLRALGRNAIEAAENALSLARDAGDEDFLAEIYGLLATLHRDADNLDQARSYCHRAIALRDQIVEGLPSDVRVAFLAKPDILALSRLQASLASAQLEGEDEPPRTQRAPTLASAEDRKLIGDHPQIRVMLAAIRRIARADGTVLIYGESGTGKELVAEALHRASDRARGPMVSVNCAALVETLLLSELFGHEKGAFTGASARRRGRFELAEGGTLFLDEIGDISPRTQVALLRVLQEKTFERVGGMAPIRANVRVVCATHRDLRAMVERGQFREDLYYRLAGMTLEVPALRARIEDLPKIADHLLQRIADERAEPAKRLTSDAIALLMRHRWPGNVRELENVLRSASLFADGDTVGAIDLIEHVDDLRALARSQVTPLPMPAAIPEPPPSGELDDERSMAELPHGETNATAIVFAQVRDGVVSLMDVKRHIERDCIARALMETGGNISQAAVLLGMKRPRLSQLVKQYKLLVGSRRVNA